MKRSKLGAMCAAAGLLTAMSTLPAHAAEETIEGLKIAKIRSVGNYSNDLYDNTVELWFTTPLNVPSNLTCRETQRVIIDAKFKHLIAAAHAALASGRLVNVHIDDTLPQRAGSCEVSWMDIL
ncbi:hypothetical protein [Mitsuaria sp. 7]|uniref:hypothetical protein n=1 Tax=Mitsuaria sp. 7 TaxID=1658665 RepID=UPI0012FC7DC1|nr:hypothetical protein [Mitsuaria sp. 7]